MKNKDKKSSLFDIITYTADTAVKLASINSIIGEKMEIDGMTVIPVSKVSAGFAGGGSDSQKKNPAGAGVKVDRTPISFLCIANGKAKIVSVDKESGETKKDILAKVVRGAAELGLKKIKK